MPTIVSRSNIVLLVAVIVASGCSTDRVLEPCPAQSVVARSIADEALHASQYDSLFEAAGAAYDVDPGLLRAIAWVETRFHMVAGDHRDEHDDHDGRPPAWGVMALRGQRLERAARLARLTNNDVKHSPAANITAAAALLAAEAHAAGVAGRPAADWASALERYTDIQLPAGRTAYRAVVLSAVAHASTRAPTVASATRESLLADDRCGAPSSPAGPAITSVRRASPNFDARAAGTEGQIAMIIVHTCEGSYISCWSWLTNAASGVSAHYVIDESGSEISYLVEEPMRAWHIGAIYDCLLNRSRRCDLNGVQSNHFTIGIEHAGFASQPSFPASQIDVSARLVCALTRRHGIPRDGQHIVAHAQLQPWNRTDPGPNWPWTTYLAIVQRQCGEVVVDDSDAFNDPLYARTSVPAGWTAASATPGYYGGGYHFISTAPDPAAPLVFEFYIAQARRYTIDARWTAGDNRSAAAPFTIRDGAGRTLASVMVDQRAQHDQWRSLATLDLRRGWHRVELSNRGPTGSVVVGDAIRVR